MRSVSTLLAWMFVLVGCVGSADAPTTSGPPQPTSSPSSPAISSQTTTTAVSQPIIRISDLPRESVCGIDTVPEGGEATVVVDGRLYGLGADGTTPRCLAPDIHTADLEWGPLGDRLRVESRILGFESDMEIAHPSVTGFEWTAPTGSRMVVVSAEQVLKFDVPNGTQTDITFLQDTEQIAYHPAGTHLLAVGSQVEGRYGLWLASNQGTDPVLIAADEGAALSEPSWSWLGEPLFVAEHPDGQWHIHRVELTTDGALEGPILVDSAEPIDVVTPARHDPVMLAYRLGAGGDGSCAEQARAAVSAVDLPEPLSTLTSTPIGWLSMERLLVMAYPDGCDAPGDLWVFSAGFCPGSEYGAQLIIEDIHWAAAREGAPPPPPSPDFSGIIDPAPA